MNIYININIAILFIYLYVTYINTYIYITYIDITKCVIIELNHILDFLMDKIQNSESIFESIYTI